MSVLHIAIVDRIRNIGYEGRTIHASQNFKLSHHEIDFFKNRFSLRFDFASQRERRRRGKPILELFDDFNLAYISFRQ